VLHCCGGGCISKPFDEEAVLGIIERATLAC
jgi:hypothetical protein